jgi:MutS domain V
MDARAIYTESRGSFARRVEEREARSRLLGLTRLVLAAAAIALLAAIVWVPLSPAAWAGEGALAVVFAALVVIHSRVIEEKGRAAAALRFHERGLARLDGKWTESLATGDRVRPKDHPFADDLDVFGRASLFQRLDATETQFGEERLAALLSATELPEWPAAVEERQAAVRDLAGRVGFREKLSALGALLGEEKPDPRPFLQWAEGSVPFDPSPLLVWIARLLPVVVVGLLSFGPALGLPRTVLAAAILVEIAIVASTRGTVAKIAGVVAAREAGLVRYGEMLEALEKEPFEAPLLVRYQERLRAGGASATAAMARLGRVLGFLEARNNEVFRFLIGPVLLWDLNLVVLIERWRARTGPRARAWFDVLGEVEALASLATLPFERPAYAWPELAPEAVFEATRLGHPLLDDARRVDNDVTLPGPGRALIVTGSNMSGKSTLLRAIGTNAVLALAGAPVCAASLRIGPLRVATSMRVSDSLEQGVSHFYAELKKLKRVLDLARAEEGGGRGTVLFLLDEILHGTNSRERILGARAIVRELVAVGAVGAVSTHDLGISDLEKELPGKVANVHFEEQVEGDKMTFDYRLREGIVKSSNALRLMKLVGIDVVPAG